MAWKKAAYAPVSVRDASAKSRTGPPAKKTENIVPALWTVCSTPAAARASDVAALIVSPTRSR